MDQPPLVPSRRRGARSGGIARVVVCSPAIAKETTWTLANSLRSLANPYHATFAKGGAEFAKSIDATYVTLVTEGNSEKGISDIKALLQRTGGKLILNVDPNDSPDARVIVDEVQKSGGYVVTQWNKPNDLHPWDHNPNYVAHMSFDGVPAAKALAKELFKAFGGEGGVVAIGGILSNVPAIERKAGLDQAIAEIGWQGDAARFPARRLERTEGLRRDTGLAHPLRRPRSRACSPPTTTWAWALLRHLRQAGLAGKVPVVGLDGIAGAVKAVEAGEFAATVAWDPLWTGGMGLAIPYAAATGKIDIAKEPKEHREFYGTSIMVTKDSVAAFKSGGSKLNFSDLWGKDTGQIQYRG